MTEYKHKENNKTLKLNTRGRFAVMALIELDQKTGDAPVSLAEITKSGNISLSYLEQLFAGLRRNGLVKSYRGPGGGYILAKPATEIFISDILRAAEDCVPAKRNAGNDSADECGNDQTYTLWSHIGRILHASLRHISLDDVANDRLNDHATLNKLFEVLS